MARTNIIMRGLLANRPAPGVVNRLYFTTDAGAQRVYQDTGLAWELRGVVEWSDLLNKPATFTPTDGSVTAAKMAAANKAIEIVTSTTRPASPVEGQHIYEADTNKTLKNTGTPAAPVWEEVGTGGGGSMTQATETALGGGELATQAETDAGTDDARIVTPLKAATRYRSKADLADTADPAKGDALIGFKQSGDGAVARTVHDKLTEFVSAKDYGVVGDGVTDDSAALARAIEACKQRARVKTSLNPPSSTIYKYEGLPTLVLSPGTIVNTQTHSLRYISGFRILGGGKQVSVIEHRAGSDCFYINRTKEFIPSHFTLQNRDPAATGAVKGLMENSCAFHIKERKEDNLDGTYAAAGTLGTAQTAGAGSTLRITFDHVEVNEFHKAYRLDGNQQLDDIVWIKPRHRDNFIDFEYRNSQAVNQQIFGGEVLYGVSYPEADYQARLNAWTTPPNLYDGALFSVVAGGQLAWFGGSKIANKTNVLYEIFTAAMGTATDDAFVGSNVNILPMTFYNLRTEVRQRDGTGYASLGVTQDRITEVRYMDPGPPDANGVYRHQAKVKFRDCDWNVDSSGVFAAGAVARLFHLANRIDITLSDCKIYNAAKAAVDGLLSDATATYPGTFFSERSSTIAYRRQNTTELATGTTERIEHRVLQLEAPHASDQPDFVDPLGPAAAITAAALTANTAYFVRFRVGKPTRIARSTFVIGTASGNVDVGVYKLSSDQVTLSLLSSSGAVAMVAGATQTVAYAGTVDLMPGTDYYLALAPDNATATIGRLSSANAAFLDRGKRVKMRATSYPLPASIPFSELVNTSSAVVMIAEA